MSITNTNELIVYTNSRNGLGIRVLGAKRPTNKSGIYIKQLLDDGLAQRDGRLKVGDQIVSINDETTIGISREYAVNLLRSAAATNQVRLHVRHFYPNFANEYQKFLFDEKSTDDDDDEIHRILNHNHNRSLNPNTSNDCQNRSATTTNNEVRMRRSGRKPDEQQPYRHSAYDLISTEQLNTHKGLDVSHEALQSLLNSKFQLIDLVDLLKKISPTILLSNDQKREYQFLQQLSQTNPDGRISLKDFERQSSILLGERINLLSPFYSSSTRSSNKTDQQTIVELRHELALCRSTITELQNQIITCEKSQRLSEQVEIEYEDLLKFVYEQLREYKQNEINQSKYLRANDQLIRKLFNYLSNSRNKTTDEEILSQLKYEYEQQKTILSRYSQETDHNLSNRKSHQQV